MHPAEHDYPDAARSLLEELEECFTINHPDVPRLPHRCLAASNLAGALMLAVYPPEFRGTLIAAARRMVLKQKC
jgi:hypothetical protein